MADDSSLPEGNSLEEKTKDLTPSASSASREAEHKPEGLELQEVDLTDKEPSISESIEPPAGGDTDSETTPPATVPPPDDVEAQDDRLTTDSGSAKPSNISAPPSLIPSSFDYERAESDKKSSRELPGVVDIPTYLRRSSGVSSDRMTGASQPRPEQVLHTPPKDVDRDPNRINSELTLTFSEVFAEPDKSVHSIDCVWKTSNGVFSAVKLWTYRVLTIFCALPCSCVWAVSFAILSVASIWIWSPWLKAFRILMLCNKKMFDYIMIGFVMPVFEAVGRVFSSIRLSVNTHGEAALVYR